MSASAQEQGAPGREAAQAAREAAQAAREAAREAVAAARAEMDAARSQDGSILMPPPPFGRDFDRLGPPDGVVAMSITLFIVMGLTIVCFPLARAFARRMDRKSQPASAADMTPRLDRIEQAVEAIAIEVERISEGQRFTNRLMSEMRALPAPNPLEQWPATTARVPEPVERSTGSRRDP